MEHENLSNFRSIKQGTATNTLTKIRPGNGWTVVEDGIKNMYIIKKDGDKDFHIEIPTSCNVNDLKTTAYQLLDALLIKFTESGGKSPRVVMPVKEYAELRGLKDYKTAKEQAQKAIAILQFTWITWTEKKVNGKEQKFPSISIITAKDGKSVDKGTIDVTFNEKFLEVLGLYSVMPYPDLLLKLDNKRNPNSYPMLRKIAELKNMNAGKKNENIVSVKTLLSVAGYIPKYKDVAKKGRRINQQIIEPFERDLNALESVITWEYCHRGGAPLEDNELDFTRFVDFEKCLVKITWAEYPDQSERLERKQKRIKAAERKRKKKKQTTEQG